MRPTGACVGVAFQVASAIVRRRLVDGGCPGGDVHRLVLGPRRAGPGHERRARRPLLLDLQGYPQGAGQRRRRPATATARSRSGSTRARRAWPIRRSPGSSSARAARSSPSAPPDGIARRSRRPNGEQRTYAAFARQRRRRVARRACAPSAWAYDAPAAPRRCTARPVVTGGEGGVVALRDRRASTRRDRLPRVTSPTGETVRDAGGRSADERRLPRTASASNTATPSPSRRLALRAAPGLGGSASGAAVTVSAQRHRRAARRHAHAELDVERRRHVDGDRARHRGARAATGRRCATASPARAARARRRGRRDRDLHRASPTARSTASRCAPSRGTTTRRSGARTTTASGARRSSPAARRAAGPSSSTRAPNVSGTGAHGSSASSPTRPSGSRTSNRVEFAGWGPARRLRPRPRHPGALRPRLVGDRDPVGDRHAARRAARPYQVQARGGCSRCVGGIDLVAAGRLVRRPAGGKAAFTFGNAGLRYFDARARAARTPPAPGTVPVGAVRVEGIEVTVDWSAQGWGLAPRARRSAATCTRTARSGRPAVTGVRPPRSHDIRPPTEGQPP